MNGKWKKLIVVTTILSFSITAFSQINDNASCSELNSEINTKNIQLTQSIEGYIKVQTDIMWISNQEKNKHKQILQDTVNKITQKITDGYNCKDKNTEIEQTNYKIKHYESDLDNLKLAENKYGTKSLNPECYKNGNCVNTANIYLYNLRYNDIDKNENIASIGNLLVRFENLSTQNNAVTASQKNCKKILSKTVLDSIALNKLQKTYSKNIEETVWLNNKEKESLTTDMKKWNNLLVSIYSLFNKKKYVVEEIGDYCSEVIENIDLLIIAHTEEVTLNNKYLESDNNNYFNTNELCTNKTNCLEQRRLKFFSELNLNKKEFLTKTKIINANIKRIIKLVIDNEKNN